MKSCGIFRWNCRYFMRNYPYFCVNVIFFNKNNGVLQQKQVHVPFLVFCKKVVICSIFFSKKQLYVPLLIFATKVVHVILSFLQHFNQQQKNSFDVKLAVFLYLLACHNHGLRIVQNIQYYLFFLNTRKYRGFYLKIANIGFFWQKL